MSEEQQQEVVEVKTVTRDLVINSHASEVDIALLEDNSLVELHREKTNNQFAVGDVYLGRVKKILPGLNAAFVDVGYPKEAFLHYLDLGLQANSLIKYKKAVVGGDDVAMDKFKLEPDLPKNGKIGDLLNVGDLLPVQIAKEPIHTKGPRITAEVSFAGRYLVLVPFSNRISVSQKIRSSEERNRLRRLIQSIKPANYGVIIRTVAEGKKVADLDADLRSLIDKWEQCIIEMKKMTTFGRMVSEMDQTSVMLRDLLNESFNNIHVNDEKLYEEIQKNIQTFAPQKVDIVQLYKGKEPIFDYFNVTKQIKGFFGKIVTIRNGVYLVIEHTEAMHVIDVNSGHRVNKENSQEDNAFQVNIEAAKEIARQLRLRDMAASSLSTSSTCTKPNTARTCLTLWSKPCRTTVPNTPSFPRRSLASFKSHASACVPRRRCRCRRNALCALVKARFAPPSSSSTRSKTISSTSWSTKTRTI